MRRLILGAALVLAACGQTTTDGLAGANRCVDVPPVLVDAISAGLKFPGVAIRDAKAVKSDDFEQAWFVSADLEGDGVNLDGPGDIATWVTND
jgi:hypothetical protein